MIFNTPFYSSSGESRVFRINFYKLFSQKIKALLKLWEYLRIGFKTAIGIIIQIRKKKRKSQCPPLYLDLDDTLACLESKFPSEPLFPLGDFIFVSQSPRESYSAIEWVSLFLFEDYASSVVLSAFLTLSLLCSQSNEYLSLPSFWTTFSVFLPLFTSSFLPRSFASTRNLNFPSLDDLIYRYLCDFLQLSILTFFWPPFDFQWFPVVLYS